MEFVTSVATAAFLATWTVVGWVVILRLAQWTAPPHPPQAKSFAESFRDYQD